MNELTAGQFQIVYNAFSFTIAVMGAATVFFFLGRSQVAPAYRPAITITGLVTLVACYHYFRIFSSWEAAYAVLNGKISPTGVAFNDGYRYVDWLLTVPLLLVELILVMRLSRAETVNKSIRLGVLAALMIILGYPGEIATSSGTRWLWWGLAMLPFLAIVYDLFVGLRKSIDSQPEAVRGMVSAARWITVISWCFYPIVFIFPMIGFTGGAATTAVQVGYTVSDIVAKAMFGVFIYIIAVRKSEAEVLSVGTEALTPAQAGGAKRPTGSAASGLGGRRRLRRLPPCTPRGLPISGPITGKVKRGEPLATARNVGPEIVALLMNPGPAAHRYAHPD